MTARTTKPGAERAGHRLLFSADEGRVRAVSPPFALLGGLRVAGVPFYYTKNGPKTMRCGFTDSTESAAQARRFT